MLYAGLELKVSDLKLISWKDRTGHSVALITSGMVSDGVQRADLRMLAQGHYANRQNSGLGHGEVVDAAISAMLTDLEESIADFATILEDCEAEHMHVYDPADSDNPSCRCVSCANMREVCTS